MGAFVHCNRHYRKVYMEKVLGLKYEFQILLLIRFELLLDWTFRIFECIGDRKGVVVHAMSAGNVTIKIKCIKITKFHQKVYCISQVATWRRRDWNKNQKTHFCGILSRNPPSSRTVNVYRCRILLIKRLSDCQDLTAQHI